MIVAMAFILHSSGIVSQCYAECRCANVVAVSDAPSDDDLDQSFRDAFSRRTMPWYDKEQDGVRQPVIPQRHDSDLSDRHDVADALPRANPATAPGGPGAAAAGPGLISALVWIGGGAIIAVILGLLVFAFLRIESFRDDSTKDKKSLNIEDHIARLPFELEPTTGDFASAAEKAYRDGDFRKAIVYLFGDVLVTMDQESLIRLQKGKTNRQYHREIRQHRQLTPFYRNVMTAFEEVFFGQKDIDRGTVDTCFRDWKKFKSDVAAIAAKKFAAANMPVAPPAGVSA